MKLGFNQIATITVAVRCLNSGYSFAQIVVKAEMTESTLRRWIRNAGFRKGAGGKFSIP
jgi:transposase-like protein